ncbi:MAG: adenylate/guanylate cyclase domain-containing protein [Rhodocyclaceae bacterium]|nr:adenylate/guanylate cyclase domain-containing protein [Rhodocyclaceae bacterium]MCA3144806.1 adenylate/guanylate cyclase domain-containing protein [Rhodocyclaceae bacterium]
MDPGFSPPALPRRISWLQRVGGLAFEASDSEEQRLRKSLLLFATGLMNLAAALWAVIYTLTGLALPNSLPLGFQLCSAILLFYFLRTKNFAVYRFLQLALFLFVPFVLQWSIGSFVSSSGIVLLALLAPIGAMVVYGHRESIPWFVAYAVMMVLSGAFDYFLAEGDADGIPLKTVAMFFVLNFTILSTIVFLLLRYFVKQKDKYQEELFSQHALLSAERAKSDALISSMLPAPIAERLKNQTSAIADSYADITVMFADLANFTEFAEALSPSEVVSFLNEVFTRLDQLAIRYRLDKIKTVGDAYMVVGGLATDRTGHVFAVADMAIAIQEMTRTDPLFLRHGTAFHIGIATGPAVAAVIGSTRLSYDVWGDTVNLAARMTGEAASGSIEVDRATFRRLASRYDFGEARKVVFKGKGETIVYALMRRKPESDDAVESLGLPAGQP